VQETAQKAAAEEAEGAQRWAKPGPYEELGQSVNIAVDEVGVKRQKASRKTEAEVKSEEKK
jgi:hypothetical protein